MKYGCCTSISNYDLLEQIGFDFIELSGRAVTSMSEKEFDKVIDKVSNGHLFCNGFNDYCPPDIAIVGPDYDPVKAEKYAQLICKRGSKLNISTIGIGAPLSRRLPEGFDKATADGQAIEFLAITADIAKQYNITILFEALNNEVCNYVTLMPEAVDIVQKINKENVKIVADFYHMQMMNEDVTDIAYAIPYITHLHIAQDIDGNRGYLREKYYDQYKSAIAAAMKEGYDSTLSIEALWGDVAKEGKQSLDILKRIEKELNL
ncbi:sugar phosphate isomerase/epimerase family protein [Petroclostridium sp. X23]|uniref:sugar phosphate isomerase/epimerase family protein n=1 Tax=Petroclostridium sp. X23 TaxID=3045146 RepID=UPI0024AE1A7A|nr:sugar phosphate isomerase/epimerase family protein [Petroclostridium sp. X23]WHH59341.1 sugar phosphate isomerase/epimerase family protein [Petroclostridium sp. X23]